MEVVSLSVNGGDMEDTCYQEKIINVSKQLTSVEICAGAGGQALGLHRKEMLDTLVDGDRLRDIADIPLDLAV